MALPTETALTGAWRAHVAEGDLPQRFAEPAFDDGGWAELSVPGHWRSAPGFDTTDGPVLHRRRFALDPSAPGRRRFLVLDGVFYLGDVWLDGDYLGATEGYFFPHELEVTGHLGPGRPEEHVLAVEVGCPPQHDRTAKRLVTGVFSYWDNLDPAWSPGACGGRCGWSRRARSGWRGSAASASRRPRPGGGWSSTSPSTGPATAPRPAPPASSPAWPGPGSSPETSPSSWRRPAT
ncbi:MAG: hypothetical protein M5U14_14440 [Acidimicrobiia bacterium]|nr:hypothetical protein [Acidimicrobiia bacterium]